MVDGWTGSQLAFILQAAFEMTDKLFLIVAEDKESAAYLQNDLRVLNDSDIFFFPDAFRQPQNFSRLNKTQVLQRTEVMNRLSAQWEKPQIVVTYPESLFEKVVSPDSLSEKRLRVQRSEALDLDTVIEILAEFGFERTDFVYDPGQFSIRGGIIDIFSHGNEWPYRIELFDDEVEHIRTFDPASQRSIKEMHSFSIIPNVNTEFRKEEKVDLLSVLPRETVLWIAQPGMLKNKLEECEERLVTYRNNIPPEADEELKNLLQSEGFTGALDLVNQLESFSICYLKEAQHLISADVSISFSSHPQPDFNKNFKLLIDQLRKNIKEGLKNYIATDNPRQAERITSICRDLEAPINFEVLPFALSAGFVDKQTKLAIYTDHQIFQRYHRYQIRKGFTKDKAISLKMLKELKPGDYVVHIDHGVGRFSGLEKIDINGKVQESVRLMYKNQDVLYVGIQSLYKISKYTGKEGVEPKLNKLGSDAWARVKRKTKKKVKDIAGKLIKLYAKRMAEPGFPFQKDGYLQNELEASFIYEDTPDQFKATQDVKEDMEKSHPMDRLVCGDVGFGKTEVAIRAAFKAVVGGKQVAVLVPTTILALQHYKTFRDRLEEFGVTVDYINRFRSTKERNQVFADAKEGKIDILIGTHAILNKRSGFKDLGLLVIDEEQKFGVSAKEKLRALKINVDTLTLTATPIPRTLSFSLMAARDMSILRTAPPNRQSIHTEIRIFNEELIRDSIYYEVNRGGQVFFVNNRVKSLPEITAMVKRSCPDVEVAMAHGKMESSALEQTLADFIDFKFDVLVCTNIIETGLDIPNANTIIINNAHQFGLSDLHQLRGRVGRSNKKAFCYLFCPPLSTLTQEARKRLKTIEEFSDLGDGVNIAMRDLDIRGAGNLLGAEQSGFINDIGYTTYQKILKEAIQELKEGEFKELFKKENEQRTDFIDDVTIEADAEMLIPDKYVTNIQERLNLYTQLDKIDSEKGIEAFRNELADRFGPVPKTVETLFEGLRLRWLCKKLGFERLSLKNRKLRCYFVMNPQSAFYETEHFQKMLSYISGEGRSLHLRLKQSRKNLIVIKDDMMNLEMARRLLKRVAADVLETKEADA
jgi:transcription-repair coupling factor (superfamily II helicase)